jgi:adenylate cyclase class 2
MEVEMKVRVEDLESMKKKLESLGARFQSAMEQRDEYFKPRGFESRAQGPGDWIVRVRRSGADKMLTLKALTEISGAWVEHETGIVNEKEMRSILENMGLLNVFTLNKNRIRGRLDEFELCLDDVRELGKFLEVALESEEKEAARDRIIDFLKGLGIEDKNIERRGYGEIIGEKLGHRFEGMR